MDQEFSYREITDWSLLSENDMFWSDIAVSTNEVNFGIHKYQGNLYSSGYVGIGRLVGTNGQFVHINGIEKILIVKPSYDVDPWKMLERVMLDEEYPLYAEEMKKKGKSLYRVFYEQKPIRILQDEEDGSEVLTALSFIHICYSLCRKKMKSNIIYVEENFNAKIRGKIVTNKNLRKNIMKGHIEKFYCKYGVFTIDTIENRILKAALHRAEKILYAKYGTDSTLSSKIHFCKVAFKHVKTSTIKKSDFRTVKTNGLYTYYKPAIQQAKYLIFKKNYKYKKDDSRSKNYIYVTPYTINMESLFEFYVRSVLKEFLSKNSLYELEKYSTHIFTQKNKDLMKVEEEKIHIIPYCIPDIIIKEKINGNYVAVLDVKYKKSTRTSREDTHQLLSYVLLTGAEKCGFIFPCERKSDSSTEIIENTYIDSPLFNKLSYYELFIGEKININIIDKILE